MCLLTSNIRDIEPSPVTSWDEKELLITSLDKESIADAEILNVSLLGSEEQIKWTKTDKGLKLSFPENKPCDYAYSFKISFDRKVGEHLESEATNEPMKYR